MSDPSPWRPWVALYRPAPSHMRESDPHGGLGNPSRVRGRTHVHPPGLVSGYHRHTSYRSVARTLDCEAVVGDSLHDSADRGATSKMLPGFRGRESMPVSQLLSIPVIPGSAGTRPTSRRFGRPVLRPTSLGWTLLRSVPAHETNIGPILWRLG